jgi:hypothetical protein
VSAYRRPPVPGPNRSFNLIGGGTVTFCPAHVDYEAPGLIVPSWPSAEPCGPCLEGVSTALAQALVGEPEGTIVRVDYP